MKNFVSELQNFCHNVCFRCSLLLLHCEDYDLQWAKCGNTVWTMGNIGDAVKHSGNKDALEMY